MTGFDLSWPADLLALPAGWPLLLAGLLTAMRQHAGSRWGLVGIVASLGLMAMAPPSAASSGALTALAVAFHVAALVALLFGWSQIRRLDRAAGLIAAGAGVAALFTLTLPGLMIWTEIIALASALIIMNGSRAGAVRAGLTYLMLQILAGALLLIGLIAVNATTGDLGQRPLVLDGIGPWAILVALLVKAAVLPFHGWLVGAYPQATPTGTLWLSAFATKVAIVALVRLFPGAEILVWLGLSAALLATLPALLERDWRRAIAWSLVSQLGVMAIGVGVGTPLALTGVVLLGAGHVVYTGILFAAAGGLEQRDGASTPGLWLTALVGALSIGLPGLAGYGGKAMIGEALVAQGQTLVEYGVVASGALVFFAIGLRPVLERLRPTPLADGLRPGEIAAAIVAALASLALGLGAPLLEPQAEAIWDEHAVLLQLGALAVVLVGGMALSRLKRLPPGREQVARWAILPPPATGAWPRPALTGGDRLARALGVVLGRLGHGAIALSRRLVTGGAGEGVLWALALLGLGLIASFA